MKRKGISSLIALTLALSVTAPQVAYGTTVKKMGIHATTNEKAKSRLAGRLIAASSKSESVNAYKVQTKDGKYITYAKQELQKSFIEKKRGGKGALYLEFLANVKGGKLIAFRGESGKFVDYKLITSAFMKAKRENRPFNISEFMARAQGMTGEKPIDKPIEKPVDKFNYYKGSPIFKVGSDKEVRDAIMKALEAKFERVYFTCDTNPDNEFEGKLDESWITNLICTFPQGVKRMISDAKDGRKEGDNVIYCNLDRKHYISVMNFRKTLLTRECTFDYNDGEEKLMNDIGLLALKHEKNRNQTMVFAVKNVPIINDFGMWRRKAEVGLSLFNIGRNVKYTSIFSLGYGTGGLVNCAYQGENGNGLGTFNYVFEPDKEKRVMLTEDVLRDTLDKEDKIVAMLKPSMPEREKVKFLHDYILNNVHDKATYTKEINLVNEPDWHNMVAYNQKYNSSVGALEEHVANREGFTSTFITLLYKAGIDVKRVTSTADKNITWVLVKVDGKWYHVDIFKDKPSEGGKISYKHFLLADSEMKKYASWEKIDYRPTSFTEDKMTIGEAIFLGDNMH